MNTMRVKAVINSGGISTADWTNAKSLADSIKSACATYGTDYKFTVALIGEKNTLTDKDGTITITESVSVNGKINFEPKVWSKMQSLEDSIQGACAAVCTVIGGSGYSLKTYTGRDVTK